MAIVNKSGLLSQIPLTQTLITINLKGFATEADELPCAAKLDIEKLRVSLGE
ncbi:MAG: hypothetical protein IPP15_21160 [Saprospiraceae bacterium]|uniref:Uncharacterized protein n=1 Tax=Candidatus Opimibacter skivensis TaxID=2982028 RepID=A0A9D7SZ58_9BACT|nr:hypothetical protein [Candidatus Opimibacter skivensis]